MTETLVAQWRPKVRLYAQDGRMRASFVTTRDAGELKLPQGDKGPAGLAGPDSAVFRLMGKVANAAALPVGLGLADRGKTWAVMDVKKYGYWTGSAWNIGGSLAITGMQGDPLRVIRGPVETLTSDVTSISVSLDDVEGGKQLSLSIPSGPRGGAGIAGPSNKILGAVDLDEDPQDQGVLMSDGIGWVTGIPSPSNEIQTASLINSPFTSGLNLLSVVPIQARPYQTRLIVMGEIKLIHSTAAYWWASPDVYIKVVQVANGVQSVIGTGIWEYSTGSRPVTIVPSTSNVTIDANVTGEVQIQLWLISPIGKYVVTELNAQVLRVPTV